MVRHVEPSSKGVETPVVETLVIPTERVETPSILIQLSRGSTWFKQSLIQVTSRVAGALFEFTKEMNSLHHVERARVPHSLGFEALDLRSRVSLLNQVRTMSQQRIELLTTLSQMQVACCHEELSGAEFKNFLQFLLDLTSFHHTYRYDTVVLRALEITGAVMLEALSSRSNWTQDETELLISVIFFDENEKVLRESFGKVYGNWTATGLIQIQQNVIEYLKSSENKKLLKQLVMISENHPLKKWSIGCLDGWIAGFRTSDPSKMHKLHQRSVHETNSKSPLFIDALTRNNLARVQTQLQIPARITNWTTLSLFITQYVDFYTKVTLPFEKICKLLPADELLPLIVQLALKTEHPIFLQRELLEVIPVLQEQAIGTEKEYILTNLEMTCTLFQSEY